MGRLRDAFITGTGVFLPGEPIPNDRMEDFIGRIGGRSPSVGQRVLRWNGINTRHYALTPDGEALHSNASAENHCGRALDGSDASVLMRREEMRSRSRSRPLSAASPHNAPQC